MAQTELVSVVIPAYNSRRFIEEAIQSSACQTYKNMEIIVVDDKSNDDTYKVVKEISEKDQRIHLLYNKKNEGPAFTRNKALKFAKGRYIAFLDSDDFWLPEKIEKQIQFMENSDAVLSFTNYRRVTNLRHYW